MELRARLSITSDGAGHAGLGIEMISACLQQPDRASKPTGTERDLWTNHESALREPYPGCDQ